MSNIRGKDTKPEIEVRKALHKRGFRYRLHVKDLPGRPDIVFPRYNVALFVNGCFWHRHPGCRHASTPSSNEKFWNDKFERNVARDRRNKAMLETAGFRVAVIWECETRGDRLDPTIERMTRWMTGVEDAR